jgi:hypothetical protein
VWPSVTWRENSSASSSRSVPVANLMTPQKYVLNRLTPYSLSKAVEAMGSDVEAEFACFALKAA